MNMRRYYVPDAIIFLTQVVYGRETVFHHQRYLDLLRTVLHNVKELHPFQMVAYVFLPNHFHLMIRPTGVSTFSDIMQSLKRNFTLEYKDALGITGHMRFWQKGFWDHVIRDEDDFSNHLDYVHYNPVKHGLVTHPEDWPHSSFVEWKQRGAYVDGWGWSLSDFGSRIDWHDTECMWIDHPVKS